MTHAAELVAEAKRLGQGKQPVKVKGFLRCGSCGHLSGGHWTAGESRRDEGLPQGFRLCQFCWGACPSPAVSGRTGKALDLARVRRAQTPQGGV